MTAFHPRTAVFTTTALALLALASAMSVTDVFPAPSLRNPVPRGRGPRLELQSEGQVNAETIALVSTRALPGAVFALTRGPSAQIIHLNEKTLEENSRDELTSACEFDSAAPVVAVHQTMLYAAKGAHSAYTPDDPQPAAGDCGAGFVARFDLESGQQLDPLDASGALPENDEGASSIAVNADGTRLYLLTRTSFVVFDLESGDTSPISVVTPERTQPMERWVELALAPDGTGVAAKNTRLTSKGAHLVHVDFSSDEAVIDLDVPQNGARGIGAMLIDGDSVVIHEAYLPCHFGIALQKHDRTTLDMTERIMYKEKEYTHEDIKNFAFQLVEGSYGLMVMRPGEEQEEFPSKINVVDVRTMDITFSLPVTEEIAHVAVALERASVYTLSTSGHVARYFIRLPVL